MANAPSFKSRAAGTFGLEPKARNALVAATAPVVLGLVTAALCAQLVTQWLAARLQYQAGLGEPALRIGATPFYAPWSAPTWAEMLRLTSGGTDLANEADGWFFATQFFCFLFSAALLIGRLSSLNNRASEVHGSARFADKDEIVEAGLLPPPKPWWLRPQPVATEPSVIVGRWLDGDVLRYLRDYSMGHILTYAPTGSGKGVGLVLPNLLSWTSSTIVLDPKGENFALTAGWRASQGQNVYRLDFGASEATNAINPLSEIRIATDQETADVQRLTDMIVNSNGDEPKGDAKHWTQTAGSLITATLLHILYRAKLQGRTSNLGEALDELTDPDLPHEDVLESWLNYPHDPDRSQGWTHKNGPTVTHPVVAAAAREQLDRPAKERGSVLSSAVSALSIFRDPLLRRNTSRSDFAIRDIMDAHAPTTIYLVFRPNDAKRLRAIVRILLDFILRRLVESMKFENGKMLNPHKHSLLLLLDEFPILGNMAALTELIAYVRGWGIKVFLITQDYEQLVAAYGQNETISSNCHIRLAYAPGNQKTAKLLSDALGKQTVALRPRGLFAKQNNEHLVGRNLLDPDEVRRLPGPRKEGTQIVEAGQMLILPTGCRPIRGTQPLFFRDDVLLERSQRPPPRIPTNKPQQVFDATFPGLPKLNRPAPNVLERTPGCATSTPEPNPPETANAARALVPGPTALPNHDARAPEPLRPAVPAAEPADDTPQPETVDLTHEPPLLDPSQREANQRAFIDACSVPVATPTFPEAEADAVLRDLNASLRGLKIRLLQDVVLQDATFGPRLLRVHLRLHPAESIDSVRRRSEDIARAVGTSASDVHIVNVPERRAVGIDLPVPGLTYPVPYTQLRAHPSFDAARRSLALGFCAGVDVYGRPLWVDLASMPHLLVAGTTGSGKTVFLRNILLTLLLARTPSQLRIRLCSSKPQDFAAFADAPHTNGAEIAHDCRGAAALATQLVDEMNQRFALLAASSCDHIDNYNRRTPKRGLPRIVAIFDEYADTRSSFPSAAERSAFDTAISRLAQKARAAGIHLVLCMQRPDSKAVDGSIKANILHRAALKLPQANDSRVILDASGAESLLGQGDLLYRADDGSVTRLQVPELDTRALSDLVKGLAEPAPRPRPSPPHSPDLSDSDYDAEPGGQRCP